jgi:hypothetical protein
MFCRQICASLQLVRRPGRPIALSARADPAVYFQGCRQQAAAIAIKCEVGSGRVAGEAGWTWMPGPTVVGAAAHAPAPVFGKTK